MPSTNNENEELTNLVTAPPDADWATIDWITSHAEAAERSAQNTARQPGRKSADPTSRKTSFRPHGESFFVALLCGLILGCVGVFSDACTHWVNSFRSGICANFFWLGRGMCCVEAETCDEYYSWGQFFLGRDNQASKFVDFLMFVTFSTITAVVASFLCKVYAPYASGGGIAEVKTIVCGYQVKRYLGGWTLITKVIAMCFSTGSGLTTGKEGPFVHIGACVGGIVSSFFKSYKLQIKRRQMIIAGCGAGMAVAFGAPVGGVIFALEEVSGLYDFKALMAALVAGVTAVLLQSRVDLWHTGRIVQFSVNYRHDWHFFELPLFAVLGVVGGFTGAAYNMANLQVVRWRKRHLKQWRMCEVAVAAAVTAIINFVIPYGTGSMLELLGECFQDCTPESHLAMCQTSELQTFFSILITATVKFLMFIYTVGMFIPGGILVPSLTVGALLGRAFGMIFRSIQETYASSYLFTECSHQGICVVPGVYAIVGAAAVLTGVTRMTVCLAIIMFELTGSLESMVPVTITILCSKAAGEALGVEGTYDIGIEENKLPYLDPKKEFHLSYVARDVYKGKQFIALTAYGLTVRDINRLIQGMAVTGFPVVVSDTDNTLLGYAPAKKLVAAIQLAASQDTSIDLDTFIRFKGPHPGSESTELDLTPVLENCMLQVEPECSVKKLLYLFKSLGTHHIVVCRYSKFEGFISKKDLIDFMRQKEREELVEEADLERQRHAASRQH